MSLGQRLRAARARAGLSLRQAADLVSVSHTAIAKYEKDEDVPSSPVLIALADVFAVDLGFLFRASSVTLGAAYWRKTKGLSKSQQASILAKTQDKLERYLEVEELLELGSPRPAVEFALSPVRSVDDAELVAEELRRQWELGLDPIDDVAEVLENHGIRVIYLDESEAFDGLTVEANDDMKVIVLNAKMPGDRRRFSLAHELAHIVMNVVDGVDTEEAAHRFAGAFLFPTQMVISELGESRKQLSIYELHLLKHRWGASMGCIIHRAEQSAVITPTYAKRLFAAFSAKGWKKLEPGDQYPGDVSRRFERLVMKALAEDAISRPKAAELLGMPFDDFRASVRAEHGADLVGACDR